MTVIEISQNLRPLRIAYVVRPGDFVSLERVITLNSFLWGARYNPILPLYRRTPKDLREDLRGSKGKVLFFGSVDFFQPDFLVRTEGIEESDVNDVSCDSFHIDEISKEIANEGRPGIGVGILEILRNYYNREEKFIRKNQIEYILPTYGRYHRCFLKSIFGTLPEELSIELKENIVESFDAQEHLITLKTYLNLFQTDKLDITNINSDNISIDYTSDVPRDRYVVYYLDPNSFIDIVSYANLKAAGHRVLPIAKQIAQSDEAKAICLDFINEGSWVHSTNPHAKTHVTLQKSPSVEQAEVEDFYEHLSPPRFEDDDWPRCIMRHWLPQFWSRFHQERGNVNCAQLTVAKKQDEVRIRDGRFVRVPALEPDFISDQMLHTAEPRYAIDIAIDNYGSKDFEAGIIPSGSDHVARSFGMFEKREWLIKRSGITYFSRYGSPIYFDAPKAQDVFLGWLETHGWQAEISDPGKVAYQMLRHLEGPRHIIVMRSRKFVEYFSGNLFANDKSVKAGEFIHKVTKEIYEDLGIFWGEDKFLKTLLDSKIVQLGTKLQCGICSRRSWHPINQLNYSVGCPHCLSDFEIPSHNPRAIEWSYKTIGPFAARGRAAGSYCVLLTAHFFRDDMPNRGGTTTILSFRAEKGSEEIEADLGLFFRERAFFDRTLETIFCECKTFNRFQREDVEKMRKIANEFPGAMLVFATLNEKLSDNEKSLITPFVRSCNKYHERDRPINPIMILTGTELFASIRPPYGWKGKGGKYEKLSERRDIRSLLGLCRATQKIYLDLDPWNKDWEKEWAKRHPTT